MTNLLFSSILSLMTSFVSPDASVQHEGAHRGPQGRAYGMCEKLECTAEQRAQIQEIRARTPVLIAIGACASAGGRSARATRPGGSAPAPT